jgi:hypothetical protein
LSDEKDGTMNSDSRKATPKDEDIQLARNAVAGALKAHRTLRQTIKETNGSRPKLVAALADSLGIDRPDIGCLHHS